MKYCTFVAIAQCGGNYMKTPQNKKARVSTCTRVDAWVGKLWHNNLTVYMHFGFSM